MESKKIEQRIRQARENNKKAAIEWSRLHFLEINKDDTPLNVQDASKKIERDFTTKFYEDCQLLGEKSKDYVQEIGDAKLKAIKED